MNNILLSIVVPIYNQEKYLEQCIKSVLEQNFNDYELILVDDGSTDSSGSICDEYAQKHPRIKVIHKENGGLVSARKCGAAIASAQYIVALDSDDYMSTGSLSHIANIIQKHSPDIISTGFVFFDETSSGKPFYIPAFDEKLYTGKDLEHLKRCSLFDSRSHFYKFGLPPAIWANIMRKDLYLNWQNKVDDRIKMGEDVCVTFPAVLACQRLYVTHFPLIHYRILSTSISHRFREDDIKDLKLVISHFDNLELSNYDAKNQFNTYILRRATDSIASCAQHLSKHDFFYNISKLDQSITERIKLVNQKKLNTKTKLLACMIVRRLWGCLRLYYKLRN